MVLGVRFTMSKFLHQWRRSPKAFTLIELLLYTATFAGFALLLFGFYSTVHKRVCAIKTANSKIVRVNVALTLLQRDLMSASAAVQDWDLKYFIFKRQTLDKSDKPFSVCVGWALDRKGLCRKEGVYDFVLQRWSQVTSAFIGDEIISLALSLASDEHNNLRVKISYVLRDEKEIRQMFVSLRNRVWL